MHREFERPQGKTDLENREAAGFWKAISLSNDIGKSEREIDLDVILEINKCILENASPESAGKLRVAGQDVKKLACIEPPPGSAVHERMYEFEKDMKYKISIIPPRPHNKKGYRRWVDEIFNLAAWTQHSIVAIHPFSDGNGRTARLMTNVILRRYGFPPSDVKIEADDKDKYINALCQIDTHSDYELLKDLILKGSIETLKKERERRLKQSQS